MKLLKKLLVLVALILAVNYAAGLLRDSQTLQNDLVRLHVVANSDSQQDQAIKLKVRDAVTALLQQTVSNLPTAQEVRDYLQSHLPEIEERANQVLSEHGFSQRATVSLTKEAFPTREYDTFSLPAGVYNALRITIGEGEGRNWWCVLFPSLCVPASSDSFEEAAEVAGFSDDLSQTLTRDSGSYTVRFRILDWLGELQNKLFS